MQPFNIGDLIVIEIAMQKFLEGLDLSLEAGKHCTTIIGKIENMIAQVSAAAMQGFPTLLHDVPPGAPPTPPATN